MDTFTKTETLHEILLNASDEDLKMLVEYQGNEKLMQEFMTYTDKYVFVTALINEFKKNASGAFDSVEDVKYIDILKDVAKKIDAKIDNDASVVEIESEIIRKMISDQYKSMTDEQKKEFLQTVGFTNDLPLMSPAVFATLIAGRMSGFALYKLSMIVANQAARILLGRGLSLGANAVINRVLGGLFGPIGMFAGAVWLAYDVFNMMFGPSYKKTISSVVHIAYLRQNLRQKRAERRCPECDNAVNIDAKFCSECGAKLV